MRGDVTSSVFNDMLMCWRTNLKDVILWYCMIWLVLTVNVLHAWNALSCNVCHHSSFIGSKHLQLWLIYSSSPGSSLDFYVKISFFSRSSYYACHHATYVLNSFLGSRSKNISSRMNLSPACCWGCSSASRRCASREGRGTGRVCCQWLWASLVLGEKMLSKIHSEKFWKMRGDVTSSVFNDMLMCWRTNLKDVICWDCMIWLVLTVNVQHAWNALSCNAWHHSSLIGS